MAISSASVTRAQCDACPAVVFAEGGAEPKGLTGSVQSVDGNGQAVRASFFACQQQHVGKAIANVLKQAKPAGRGAPPARVDLGGGLVLAPYTPGVDDAPDGERDYRDDEPEAAQG